MLGDVRAGGRYRALPESAARRAVPRGFASCRPCGGALTRAGLEPVPVGSTLETTAVPALPRSASTGHQGLDTAGMGSVIKKRRKRMAKKKHRKLLKRTRVQRRNK